MIPEMPKEKIKEIKEFNKEFGDALEIFLDEWRDNKKFHFGVMATNLIYQAKIEACCNLSNYHEMSGYLANCLFHGLEKMHKDIKKMEEQE